MENNIDEMIKSYKVLSSKRKEINENYMIIKSELQTRKNALKNLIEEVRESGFDPDNLENDIRHLNEVVQLKISACQAELDDAQRIMEPMLREIKSA